MINPTAALARLDADHARSCYGGLTYPEALARFTALWCYARQIRPDIGLHWRDDIPADLAVVRTVNGLPQPPDFGRLLAGATAEDLLVHKLFAGLPRDLEDAQGVVHRKSGELDWGYLKHWAGVFATVPGRGDLSETLRRLQEDEAGKGPG